MTMSAEPEPDSEFTVTLDDDAKILLVRSKLRIFGQECNYSPKRSVAVGPLVFVLARYKLASFRGDGSFTLDSVPENIGKTLYSQLAKSRGDTHWLRDMFQVPGDSDWLQSFLKVRKRGSNYSVDIDHTMLPAAKITLQQADRSLTDQTALECLANSIDPTTTETAAPSAVSTAEGAATRFNERYTVSFHTKSPSPILADELRYGDYYFFNASIRFQCDAIHLESNLRIGIVTEVNRLDQWTHDEPVLYRELIPVNEDERDWLNAQIDQLEQVDDVGELNRLLGQMLGISATIDNTEVEVRKVIRKPFGFVIVYDIDNEFTGLPTIAISLTGVQPRNQHSFPFVVPVATQGWHMVFDYSAAQIQQLHYFVACRPIGSQRPIISHDHKSGLFEARFDDAVVVPGDGILLHWLPPQVNERVELVSVDDIHPAIIVSSPYATADNFTGKVLYGSNKLYVERSTAERLRKVQQSLEGKNIRLVVFDAYRPPYVQRQMWELIQDDRFVASPKIGSRHSRACSVDVSLADSSGNLLEMPTEFDCFDDRARIDAVEGISIKAVENRDLLQKTMADAGFLCWEWEWWHFDSPHWRSFPVLDLPADLLESKTLDSSGKN